MVTGRVRLERRSAPRCQAPTMTLLIATDTKSLGKAQMLQKHLRNVHPRQQLNGCRSKQLQSTSHLSNLQRFLFFCNSICIYVKVICVHGLQESNGPTGTQMKNSRLCPGSSHPHPGTLCGRKGCNSKRWPEPGHSCRGLHLLSPPHFLWALQGLQECCPDVPLIFPVQRCKGLSGPGWEWKWGTRGGYIARTQNDPHPLTQPSVISLGVGGRREPFQREKPPLATSFVENSMWKCYFFTVVTVKRFYFYFLAM